MTCKELIEILETFDGDKEIMVADDKFEYVIIDVAEYAGGAIMEFENDRFENDKF